MAVFTIKKGMDVPLAGTPRSEIADLPEPKSFSLFPQEYAGIIPRMSVKEGDTVRRGSPLFYHKKNDALKFRSPAAGNVSKIVLGERRSLQEIIIESGGDDEVETLKTFNADQVSTASREDLVNHLQDSGALALFNQRPFSRIADPAATPKAVFVNGMNTAPFQPDLRVVIKGDEAAFQVGLNALNRLTDGKVHLCLGAEQASDPTLSSVQNAEVHTFTGPHPSGNSSVHIHHVNPINPGDVVWTIRGVEVIQLGRLLMDGAWPTHRVISLGGPGLKEDARKYYRIRNGGDLSPLFKGTLNEGEQRIVGGDALSGQQRDAGSRIRFYDHGLTVVPESKERFFMGWMMPGLSKFSHSRLFLSRWLGEKKSWDLDTNLNGSHRTMVLTGLYDKFLPLNIMVDFLVRAVIAHDTDEAVTLGILETDPEDFALCTLVCPSKTDLGGIIRQGLDEIEEEGL